MSNTTHIPKYPVQTLEKSLDIIDLLSKNGARHPLGISDISRSLGLGKSTVHRILDTLVAAKYIEKCPRGYRLGWRLFEIGNKVPLQHDLYSFDYEILQDLCDEFCEAVNFGVRDEKDVVIVSKVDPETRLKVNRQIGTREPLHATSLGKVLISELPDEEINKLLGSTTFEAYTPGTITTLDGLKVELEKVRAQGFAIDNEELFHGLVCIAMPIRDYNNKIVAALSVSGPSFRMNFSKLTSVKTKLQQVSNELSNYMGAAIKEKNR